MPLGRKRSVFVAVPSLRPIPGSLLNCPIARHKAKQKKYVLKGNSVAGYGIAASRRIRKNEVIFQDLFRI